MDISDLQLTNILNYNLNSSNNTKYSLKELKKNCMNMIINFMYKLDLNTELSNLNINCGILFKKQFGLGQYHSPDSEYVKNILNSEEYSAKFKDNVLTGGLITINDVYKNDYDDKELLITVIHEMLHSNRNLLVYSKKQNNRNIGTYFYDRNKFITTTNDYEFYNADPSQDILHADIDNYNEFTDLYTQKEINFSEEKIDGKLQQQCIEDEALIELMAMVIVENNEYMKKGFNFNIIEIIKNIDTNTIDDDIKSIINIILRHNDYELFKWMIDPITYQIGDINYDFFNNYVVKSDEEDLKVLYSTYISGGDGPNRIRKQKTFNKVYFK